MTAPRDESQTDQPTANPEAERNDAAPNGDDPTDSIAARAYRRFEERGGEHGHDVEDWLEAEREFASRDSK